MAKMFINYGYNTEEVVFATLEEAVKTAVAYWERLAPYFRVFDGNGRYYPKSSYSDSEIFIYVNHYIDSDKNITAWRAYLDVRYNDDATQYMTLEEYKKCGVDNSAWEDEWDTEASITKA